VVGKKALVCSLYLD